MPTKKTEKSKAIRTAKKQPAPVAKKPSGSLAKKQPAPVAKKSLAKQEEKRYNSAMNYEATTTTKYPANTAGYGEPVRHATTLLFPGNYSCEVWTGSSGQDWRNCPVVVDWVFGPQGVVQFQLPHKGTGIASIDALHKPSPLVVPLNLPDFQAPNIPHKWWWNLADDMILHKPSRVFLMCFAGRGRTGTMLAILYGIVQPHEFTNAADLVRHVRTLGCDKWVEAEEQLSYIADVLNMDVGDDDGLFHKPGAGLFAAPFAADYTAPTQQKYAPSGNTYMANAIENVATNAMKEDAGIQRAIVLALKHVNAAKLYDALTKNYEIKITGDWFDQNSGTSSLPEIQASMVYILFRDHFSKIKKDFLASLSKESATDFVRICKSKVWA